LKTARRRQTLFRISYVIGLTTDPQSENIARKVDRFLLLPRFDHELPILVAQRSTDLQCLLLCGYPYVDDVAPRDDVRRIGMPEGCGIVATSVRQPVTGNRITISNAFDTSSYGLPVSIRMRTALPNLRDSQG
jgi:hypothetical protein